MISTVNLYKQIAYIPAYPETPRLKVAHEALVAVIDKTDQVKLVKGKKVFDKNRHQNYIEISQSGFKNPSYRLYYRINVREKLRQNVTKPDPISLNPIPCEGNRCYIQYQIIPDRYLYTIIGVRDEDQDHELYFYGPDDFSAHDES